ncbi:hypothetical protein OIDMADRAFT_16032 [Oidiodendron maius Zn]|uniref:Phytocyanin domain-containing protein n=1 Tax=Oidiodendron maius (strain Zn) TaxID=913774 RepID=A0A0C3HWC0_OIDMZ|nr:hypothetical protein OIDMADRAFT_16032 [Oidiodendron maius Zn]
MYFSTALFSLAAFTAVNAATSDWTIPVAVGPDGLLEYAPSSIIAPVGSKIEFIFNPKNHTVTQSSFANPCHPLAGGFFSGFVPTTVSPASTTFTITVNDTKPIWFYCGQTTGTHCQKGMVGAINAPTTGNTLEAFIALAAKANTSTSPDVAPGFGGILAASNNTVLSASSVVTSAEATSYAVSTYTTAGQVVTTTLATQTVFETILIGATPVSVAPSSSSSGAASSTSTGGAPEKTAHLLGAAVLGLGALVLL